MPRWPRALASPRWIRSHRQFKEGDLKDLNLIIKADVGGTAEVLSDTLAAAFYR